MAAHRIEKTACFGALASDFPRTCLHFLLKMLDFLLCVWLWLPIGSKKQHTLELWLQFPHDFLALIAQMLDFLMSCLTVAAHRIEKTAYFNLPIACLHFVLKIVNFLMLFFDCGCPSDRKNSIRSSPGFNLPTNFLTMAAHRIEKTAYFRALASIFPLVFGTFCSKLFISSLVVWLWLPSYGPEHRPSLESGLGSSGLGIGPEHEGRRISSNKCKTPMRKLKPGL